MILRIGFALGLTLAAALAWATGQLGGLAALGFGGAAAATATTLLVIASSRPELQAFGPAIVRARDPGAVALTFDDGPHPESTPLILEALATAGARATFFVLADRVEAAPALLRAIVEAGHEVGLHGRRHHPWLTTWSPARGAADLREALGVLAAHGVVTRWFRPPFGAVSPRLHAAAEAAGLRVAWCSVRTGDGVAMPEAKLLARCAAAVGTDIVLLHEGPGRPAARLLPRILAEWDQRGIRATTLSAALGQGA